METVARSRRGACPQAARRERASGPGWLSASRWPPARTSTSSPRRSRARRRWKARGKKRSSAPATTRVGASGHVGRGHEHDVVVDGRRLFDRVGIGGEAGGDVGGREVHRHGAVPGILEQRDNPVPVPPVAAGAWDEHEGGLAARRASRGHRRRRLQRDALSWAPWPREDGAAPGPRRVGGASIVAERGFGRWRSRSAACWIRRLWASAS